jgi:hypothetical protein
LERPVNYCKDCKHFNDFGLLCVRGRRETGNDPVTGMPEYAYTVLRRVREERESILPWRCGKRGRHFASKGD